MSEQKTYQIRYNTNSKDDSESWRLINDGKETLVSDIVITSQTKTTKDYIENLGNKYHITCEGVLEVKDGVAYIKTKRADNPNLRHLLKTITYRLIATATTVATAYCLGASWEVYSLLGVGELLIKPFIYFLHEKAWFKISFNK
jgi:uncharacterized membrane protein